MNQPSQNRVISLGHPHKFQTQVKRTDNWWWPRGWTFRWLPLRYRSHAMSAFDELKRLSPIDELKSPTVHVIREVYEGENAHETFELELDKALYAKADYIIIEPTRLGEETGRWIAVGNCLHKTAFVSGLASVAAGLIWRDRLVFCAPLCAVSVFCTGLYTISWSCDPCVQYQVEKNPKSLSKVPNVNDFSSPIVLVYTSNKCSKYSHRIVTLLAASYCAWRVYQLFK